MAGTSVKVSVRLWARAMIRSLHTTTAQMGRLVFGAEDEKRGYQRYASQALHPKTQVVKGILADECAALMKEFFAAKRK